MQIDLESHKDVDEDIKPLLTLKTQQTLDVLFA
jgi:hypothetical protein